MLAELEDFFTVVGSEADMTCGENEKERPSKTCRAWKTGTWRTKNYNKAVITAPLIEIILILQFYEIIRVTVKNLNILRLKKSLTVMLFWLLELSSQGLISLQEEVVVAVVVVVERPPMQVVVLRQMQVPTCAVVVVVVEVPVEEGPVLYPLGCSHKYVRHAYWVPHRWDNLKTFAVQSPQ